MLEKRLSILTLIAVLLTACQRDDTAGGGQEFSLSGTWVQTAMTMPSGDIVDYPNSSGFTHLFIFEDDSVMYTSQVQFTMAGTLVNPEARGSFRLLYRGGGEYIFIRDGEQMGFTLDNDTTFTIMDMGLARTFSKDRKLTGRQRDEVKRIIAEGREGYQCMFSKSEEDLRLRWQVLSYLTACIAAVLISVGVFAMRTHRSKRRIEKKLKQIMEEKAMRPTEVQEALENVEKTFLKSEYHMRLLRDIENGKTLTDSDFEKIEEQLKRVYPSFIASLTNLCSLSSVEYRVCLLIKLRVPPTGIANTLCKSQSAISSVRSRLYQKVFRKKGSSTDWDEFIMNM